MLKFSVSANLSTFAFQVESYKVLSAAGSAFVAHTLPFVEIVLGLLLLIGWRFRIWAALATVILLEVLFLAGSEVFLVPKCKKILQDVGFGPGSNMQWVRSVFTVLDWAGDNLTWLLLL